MSSSVSFSAALAKERSKHDGSRYTLEASMAKLFASETAMWVTEKAVQIHGGMGVTDEMRVGHYFKRVTVIDSQFGNVDHHLKRYGDLTIAA